MRLVRTLLVAAACASMGCDATSPLVASVGTGGGTVQSSNNSAKVNIPVGALAANTNVTVAAAPSVPAVPGLLASAAYDFGPTGTTFSSPVTISITYDPATLPANVPESSLRLYTQVGASWILVDGSSVNVATHTVSGATTHFSTYAPIGAAAVDRVVVSSSSTSLVAGSTLTLSAIALDASGNALSGRGIAWTSADPAKATVSPNGVVTGIDAGTVIITATSEGRSASVTLTVTQAPVATVAITPTAANVIIGATTTLSASLRDGNGSLLTGRSIVFTSSDPTKATVTPSGVVSGIAAGTVTITATSETRSATAAVTVIVPPVASVVVSPTSATVPVRGVTALAATPRDANGVNLTNRTIAWTSSDTAIATVSTVGVVTGVRAGTVIITATSEGKSGTATVTSVIAVNAVIITPVNPSILVGSLLALTATALDDANTVLAGRNVIWASSNYAIVSVSTTGVVTGNLVGSATIYATVDGTLTSTLVTVTAPVSTVPVATLAITPATANVNVGGSTQLTAVPKDANGNTLTNRTTVWTSSDVSRATVSNTGTVVGFGAGNVTITALSEGRTSTAAVTVVVPVVPVVYVFVTPATANVTVGATTPLTVVIKDASQNVLTGRTMTFTSDNTAIATVSGTGVITGIAAGTTDIGTTSEGVTAVTHVVVANPAGVPIAAIVVTPSAPSVMSGSTVQLNAEARDANGSALAGRTITWTTEASTFATVSTAGLVTARAAGSTHIFATAEGIQASALVTITAIPTARVDVLPANQSGIVGGTILLGAIPYDANGQSITGRTVTWSSSNTAIASVTSSGLVTGVSAGTATISATSSDGVAGSTSVTFVAGTAPVNTVTITPVNPTIPVGSTATLTATLRDANNVVLTGRGLTWTTSNSLVATVSPNGVVTAVAGGTATIMATSENKTGSTVVTIGTPAVATVAITPSPANVTLHNAIQLSTILKDANGNTLTGRTVTWQSSDVNTAPVTGSGVVTGFVLGTVTVTATSGGVTGTATVNVINAPVQTVTVAPGVTNIGTNETATLVATTADANNATLTGRTITWTTSDPSKVSVSSTGVVTGVAVGSATITATSETKTGAAVVNVAALTGSVSTPVKLLAIAAGYRHTCGLNSSGAAYCWGTNGNGALGDGTSTDHRTPVAVQGGLTFASISTDQNLSCGITAAGAMYCWGGGSQLTPSSVPARVGAGITFASVSAGVNHTCAVATDGAGYCMGSNGSGRLGTGQTSNTLAASTTFLPVVGGLRWKQIAVSNNSTCGIATTGALYCWGGTTSYFINASSEAPTPLLVSSAVNFASITHRISSTTICGLDASGAAYCTGGFATQFGAPATSNPQAVQRVGGSATFQFLGAYSDNLCGISSSGVLSCWGSNGNGQLGQGNNGPISSVTPLVVSPGRAFSSVDLNDNQSVCAIAADGTGYCWGGNGSGQIGDNTDQNKNVPTAVLGGITFRAP